jgi:hypothetical protein|nr:MAG TPA: hypothetical protein [Caudoviricetes sp.]
MKIYSPLNKVIRVTIEDQNTGTIIENTVKFSIAESNCEEVCKLIEKSFKNNLLPVITGAREIGKSRSVKIDISELDNSSAKMRKISRTINMQGVNATEVGTRMIELVNEAERLAIIKRAKELTV